MNSRTYIILNGEKRAAYNQLKRIGLNIEGVIFGGMVRDEIIGTHYSSLFHEYAKTCTDENVYEKFWNYYYHKETKNRRLIPNDMDIYFHNNENAIVFINTITEFVKEYNGKILVRDSVNYGLDENLSHKKALLIFFIGKTFTKKGTMIRINIDIIINNNPQNVIEPPFNNPDFTCNLFVMNKTHGKNYEIRLSKNTGTKLDKMSYANKLNIQTRIINDLIEGKTEFIRQATDSYAEYVNGMRIIKMLAKDIKITNLLFREISSTTVEQNCDICQLSIQSTEEHSEKKFIELLTNKHAVNVMHKSCFMRYFNNEVYKKHVNTETNEIECRCPRRNLFNFKNSYKYSSLY